MSIRPLSHSTKPQFCFVFLSETARKWSDMFGIEVIQIMHIPLNGVVTAFIFIISTSKSLEWNKMS